MERRIPVFNILFSILVLAFIYKIREYLIELKNCDCAPQTYVDRIKRLELFYLTINTFFVLATIGSFFIPDKVGEKKFPIGMAQAYLALMLVLIVLIIGIHCTFIFNVYQFYQFVKSQCPCTDHWEKDAMYIQAVMYAIPVLIVFFGLFSALILLITRSFTPLKK